MEINQNHKISVRTNPDAKLDLIDPINAYDPDLAEKVDKLRKIIDSVIIKALQASIGT